MAKTKRYTFSRLHNGEVNFPNKYCIDYTGEPLELKTHIPHVLPVECKRVKYTNDGNMILIMDRQLDSSELSILTSMINNFVTKEAFTPIEDIQQQWYNDDQAVLTMLPTIEEDLKALYDAANWSSLSIIERKILSSWHIPTPAQRLIDFTQQELDEFRYFKIYKFTSKLVRAKLTKEDIKKAPTSIDFKKDLYKPYYKKAEAKSNGRPTEKNYYFRFNTDGTFNYEDPFAKAIYTFIDEPDIFLILQKKVDICWYYNDDSIDNTISKDIGESFHPSRDAAKRIKEGELRRNNIFDDIKLNVVGMVAATETGGDFAAADVLASAILKQPSFRDAFDAWIQTGSSSQNDLIGVIMAIDTSAGTGHPWLLNIIGMDGQGNPITIRDYVVGEVMIM